MRQRREPRSRQCLCHTPNRESPRYLTNAGKRTITNPSGTSHTGTNHTGTNHTCADPTGT